jgi:hypothetical protein
MKRIILFLTLALASCNGRSIADLGPPPTDYRAQVVKEVQIVFYDPHSIQDAQISKPFVFSSRWAVCLRARAKNRLGGYNGLNHHIFLFTGNALTSSMEIDGEVCGRPDYAPFPELI